MGVAPADEQQDHEVDRAGTGRIQVAQLLPDLPVDLQAGHRRADEAELEERALRRDVGAGTHPDRTFRRLATDEDDVGTGDEWA